MAASMDLLYMALNVTRIVEMRLKHALACRRPVDYSPQLQPAIATPGHGSFPSGHATEAFVCAFLLEALVRKARGIRSTRLDHPLALQLLRHAERIAVNRTVAGVHFPVDSVAGMVLGRSIAELIMQRCGSADGPLHTAALRWPQVRRRFRL